jgi:SAM-dependent methyltransferase
MSKRVHDETFAGVMPTGQTARRMRHAINSRPNYERVSTYLHEWHGSLNNLKPDVRVFCVGMDVEGFPRNLLLNFERRGIEFTGRVVGLDFEPARVRKLKNEFRDDRRFCFCTDDPETISFTDPSSKLECGELPDRSFDVAICTYALHDKDVLKPERALQGLARLIKSDGFCLVVAHARDSFSELLTFYRQACTELDLRRLAEAEFDHFDNFAEEEAGGLLLKFFRDVQLDHYDTSIKLMNDSPDAILNDFMDYCDCFPFPGLSNKEFTDFKREAVRERIRGLAESSLHEKGYLTISKQSGAFICSLPR